MGRRAQSPSSPKAAAASQERSPGRLGRALGSSVGRSPRHRSGGAAAAAQQRQRSSSGSAAAAAAVAYAQGLLSGDEGDEGSDEDMHSHSSLDPEEDDSSSPSSSESDADSLEEIDDDALLAVDVDAIARASSACEPRSATTPPPVALARPTGASHTVDAVAPSSRKRATVSAADADFRAGHLYFLHFDCEHTGKHVSVCE